MNGADMCRSHTGRLFAIERVKDLIASPRQHLPGRGEGFGLIVHKQDDFHGTDLAYQAAGSKKSR